MARMKRAPELPKLFNLLVFLVPAATLAGVTDLNKETCTFEGREVVDVLEAPCFWFMVLFGN